jgi:hypothetical protein
VLTASTFLGAFTSLCIHCGRGLKNSPTTGYLEQTAALVGSGIMGMLWGMAWLRWAHPEGEEASRTPGVSAVVSGLVEIAGGSLRVLFVDGPEPDHRQQLRYCAVIIGSGIAALAAGIAWLIWAAR